MEEVVLLCVLAVIVVVGLCKIIDLFSRPPGGPPDDWDDYGF